MKTNKLQTSTTKQKKKSEGGTLEALAVIGALYLLASFILR
jgi:hypothetical protein